MSNTTPYRVRVAGYMLHVTSTTAPSLTDPSLNTAYKNQVVTVGTDSYFVDATGKAIKLGGGGAPEAVTYGTAAPTSTTALAGDRYFRTTDGTRAGEILEEYIFDGTGWQRMETHRQNFITALRPMYYTAGAWTDSQANDITKAADAVRVTYQDGTTEYLKYGKFTWTGHGLDVGANYWLDKNVAGGITSTPPVEGDVDQAVLFVHDADTIEVSLQQALVAGNAAGTALIGQIESSYVDNLVGVQMDGLIFRSTAPSPRNLQVATASGTAQLVGQNEILYGTTMNTSAATINATTAFTSMNAAAGFINIAGAVQRYTFHNVTTGKSYRVTAVYPSNTKVSITIERIA